LSRAKTTSSRRESNLRNAPLEVGGNWSGAADTDARAVIVRARQACLSGVALVSDRQPSRLRVEDQTAGRPHIWLHEDQPQTAWIVVDIAPLHWSQLAYQFGHELGHVLCNSWVQHANLEPPSRWLEEAMAEAFSIRGLRLLADSWQRLPPFPNNSAYAENLRKYRDDLVAKYRSANADGPVADIAAWFHQNRQALNAAHGVGQSEGPAIVAISDLLDNDADCVSDMGAVNRWPERSALPIERYLDLWQGSCAELKSPGVLPVRLRQLLGAT
jgi:hypothetical protein